MLHCILQSNWFDEDILGSYKKAGYGSQLKVPRWLVRTILVVTVHELYGLEHDGAICKLEFLNDLKEPVDDLHPELTPDLRLVLHGIGLGALLNLKSDHV